VEAYVFVPHLVHVIATLIPVPALANQIPTAFARQELYAHVLLFAIVIVIRLAFVTLARHASVVWDRLVNAALHQLVPVLDFVIVAWVPSVIVALVLIAPVVLDPIVLVTQVLIATVHRVPIVCVVLALHARVQDCVPVVLDPIALVSQVLIATVHRVPIVCVVLALHARVQDCVPVGLACSVHAIPARLVHVRQVRHAIAVWVPHVLAILDPCVLVTVVAYVTQVRRVHAVLHQIVLAIQALRAIVTVLVFVVLGLLVHVPLVLRATVMEHACVIQEPHVVAVRVRFVPVSPGHNVIAMGIVVVLPVRRVLVVLNRHVPVTVLTVDVKWDLHVPVMLARIAPVTWVRHATVA